MSQSSRRVVIESPYAGDIVENRKYARRAVLHALHNGEAPLASHLLYTQPGILINADETQRQLGIEAGHRWIAVAEAVVFYLDRGMSPGMLLAEKVAKATGIPCEYRYLDRAESDAGKTGA